MEKFYLTKTNYSPYWQLIYSRSGKRTTKSTGTKNKSEALQFLTEFKERINQKKVIPKTLAEFEREYVAWITNTHSASYIERAVKLSFLMLGNFIQKEKNCAANDFMVSDISVKIADRFIADTFSRSEHSARLYLRTLKSAINTAIRWGVVEINVFSKIKAPKPFKTFPAYIKEVELEKICNATGEAFLRDLFRIAFLSGMRLGEILSLKWESINLTEKTITLSNSATFQTKNKRDRLIPINQSLLEILWSMQKNSKDVKDLLFSKVKDVKLNGDYVSKKFKKAVRAVGLSDRIHFHTLRHSFASLIHQKGASLTVVKDLLGHSDIKTTLIYSHLAKENLVDAVELIGAMKKTDTNFSIQAGEISVILNLN
ncbi:MAG: hypothetical protein A2499_02875 [Stygiobacter sp. RIFOXYC12_FULL_38_8]|nr:MAG: hypothetical protein A2279_08195 [Stygiobacter sp. RIFOXYA12_FULL_38_9]OGV06741.1 MAG: hypothetical protein A2299_02035 [Stygiobacter sp. RIFOXYB2_FULL_37_11]OGV15124.1 MAG: hypothetical protein A2440_07195 [Stygiobacter sp. RIFOXYC2_FULL_38_25]OGV17059.1 MAG: hypothetical protein A2237_18340 [Stygiobacter sp. RIFOXYA2_FULL_38_8]OGV27319.1 MAG: hypothetical protein A2499_02875 [Stygiobacter sp. RIFOXYC12_FULL_38_8]OGV79699.1 MAG: hypothetical protein A2X65_19280 [Stygiobacter sp. GWF2_